MLTHLDSQGRASMVDVTEKAVASRAVTAFSAFQLLRIQSTDTPCGGFDHAGHTGIRAVELL